jgi:hypothetical protein
MQIRKIVRICFRSKPIVGNAVLEMTCRHSTFPFVIVAEMLAHSDFLSIGQFSSQVIEKSWQKHDYFCHV